MSGDKRFVEWGCSECRGPAFANQDHQRAARNCDGLHPEQGVKVDYPFAKGLKRCPFSIIQPETWKVLDWWNDWTRYQILPYAGDLGAQPAFVCAAIKCVHDVHLDMLAKRAPPEVPGDVGKDRDPG